MPIKRYRLVSIGIAILALAGYQLGCERAALRYPAPTRFTLKNDPSPTHGDRIATVEADGPSPEVTASQGETANSGEEMLVASGGIASDVRTTVTVLPGPAAPPSTEELNEIAASLIDAIDSDKDLEEGSFAYADETPSAKPEEELPSLIAMAEEAMARQYSVDDDETIEGTADIEVALEQEGDYKLGAGDAVEISIWDMPELDRALLIRPDGYISYPLIKEVRAAGLTPAELEDILADRLNEHLLEPEVNVVVTSFASKVFYVFGAINSPGMHPYFRDTTLLQAIISVGGLGSVSRFGVPTPYGDVSRIRIIRKTDRGREIITKNLKDLTERERLEEDIPIQPDDIIYIPEEERLVYVFGEVAIPGIIPVNEDSRVLETILASGGALPTANTKQVLLIRSAEKTTNYWCLNMEAIERGSVAHNLPVQDGDVVFVPQKFIAKVAEFVQLYSNALQPAMQTYLTSWDAWFVHERFSALRRNQFGVTNNQAGTVNIINPDL